MCPEIRAAITTVYGRMQATRWTLGPATFLLLVALVAACTGPGAPADAAGSAPPGSPAAVPAATQAAAPSGTPRPTDDDPYDDEY